MTALADLQRHFLADVYQEATHFLGNIHVHARVSPVQQFAIYRQSILSRLQKALQAIYPVCRQLLGDDCFWLLAENYVIRTPSATPDLNAYGETLPTFITAYAPVAGVPYLADVARLEWAWHRLYGAPDTAPFDFQKLADYAERAGEALRLSLPPRTTLLTSPHPVHDIFAMHQTDTTPESLTLLPDQQYHLCVWQQQHTFQMAAVTAVEWRVLTAIEQGFSLGQLCDINENITRLLPDFIQKGWIADVHLP